MGNLHKVFNPRPKECKEGGDSLFTQGSVGGDEILISESVVVNHLLDGVYWWCLGLDVLEFGVGDVDNC